MCSTLPTLIFYGLAEPRPVAKLLEDSAAQGDALPIQYTAYDARKKNVLVPNRSSVGHS